MTEPAHFLIVGDATDLPLLHHMLAQLSDDAFGQVFVEVASPIQISELPAPAGVSVMWLTRETRTGFAPRGERAAQAVLAWLAEWMPEERDDAGEPSVMWIGCSTSIVIDRLYAQLGARFANLHLHHPH